jgi:hypothetical protein
MVIVDEIGVSIVMCIGSWGGSCIKGGDDMVLFGEVLGLGWMLSWNLLGRVWDDSICSCSSLSTICFKPAQLYKGGSLYNLSTS